MKMKKIFYYLLYSYIKILFIIGLIGITSSNIYPTALSSSNYRLDFNDTDAGGIQAYSDNYQMKFQAISVNPKVSSNNNNLLVSGIHFSSEVLNLTGNDPNFDRLTINMSATQNEIMTSKVEFIASINSSIVSIGYDNDLTNGWQLDWNTTANVPITANVTLLARGFDGLTWGKLFETSVFVVDNEIPVINALTASNAHFSPNNATSIGVKDDTTISASIVDSFPNTWSMDIKSGSTVVKSYNGNLSSASVSQLWNGLNELSQYVDDGIYTYYLTVNDRAGNQKTNTGNVIVDNTSPTIISITPSANGMDINSTYGELSATWNATDALASQITYDLYYAKDPYTSWTNELTGSSSTSWTKTHVADYTYYKMKVVAFDNAGNKVTQNSTVVMTPDRTAPTISTLLSEISGTEDQNFTVDITSKKSDNASSGTGLSWVLTEYDNSNSKSTYPLFSSATVTNGTTDTLSFILKPNANTDNTLAYNEYGYYNRYIKLKLVDEESNWVEKELPVNIANVNDKPVIHTMISDGSDGVNYHFFMNEDHSSTTIALDNFAHDIDTPTSSLTWVASANSYVTMTIGNAVTNHSFQINPLANWYGNTISTLNVTDGESVPANSYDSQAIKIRVWPVNDTPVISSSLAGSIQVDEDNNIVLNLHSYESDANYEDSADQLNWTVRGNDSNYIASVSGENTPSDIITLSPVANKYGTTNITVRLTDTDTQPQSIFPNYTPQPLYTEKSIDLTWYPVNDAPVIGNIPAQSKSEDSPTFSIDLSSYKSDVANEGESASDLTWNYSINNSNLFTITQNNDVFTFTPKANAWGRATVNFTLSDTDTHINFPGYTPNPKTSQKSISFVLLAVNDIPSISSVNVSPSTPFLNGKAKVGDTLTISAIGYSDVGYNSDTRDSSASGDEFASENDPSLNFIRNTKRYDYKWYVDNTLVSSALDSTSPTISITIPSDADGKTFKIEVTPDDGVDTGTTLASTFPVNYRPGIISPYTPDQVYYVTSNIVVTWNVTTDTDLGDTVKYLMKVWQATGADDETAPAADLNSPAYWDSGWRTDYIRLTNIDKTFPPGKYWWTVFSSNQFVGPVYDYRTPTWVRSFTVQESLPPLNELVGSDDINADPNNVPLAGNVEILYGSKPKYTSVWLGWENNINGTITNDFIEIVPLNANETWSYQISYPTGTTTYNIYLKDSAGNLSESRTFIVITDNDPPVDVTFSNLTYFAEDNTYGAYSSTDYFTVTGTKEANSGIWFTPEGESTPLQLYPITNSTTFSFNMVRVRNKGIIFCKDRAGNNSSGVTVNIRYLIGAPTISLKSQSQVYLNTHPNDPALSQEQKDAMAYTNIVCTSNRLLTTYSYTINDGSPVTLGSNLVAGGEISFMVSANQLVEGSNTIYVKGTDQAGSEGSLAIAVTKNETPAPIIIKTYVFSNTGVAYIVGEREADETILINNSATNVHYSTTKNEWWFQTNDFNFATTDIVITAIDTGHNVTTLTKWDHANYPNLAVAGTLFNILEIDLTSLPNNILTILTYKINKDKAEKYGLSEEQLKAIFNGDNKNGDLFMNLDLEDSIYQTMAQKFDQSIIKELSLANSKVRIHIPYKDTLRIEEDKLTLAYFNEKTNAWEIPEDMDIEINKERNEISALIPKIGIWGILEHKVAATDLDHVRVYPNPYKPNDQSLNTGDSTTGITFDQLTSTSTIRIYTLTGQLVRSENISGTSWSWDAKNMSGQDVASGVYIYIIKSGNFIAKGKFTIIR